MPKNCAIYHSTVTAFCYVQIKDLKLLIIKYLISFGLAIDR